MTASPAGDINTTTIYVNNVDDMVSDWTTHELNLAINKSNLTHFNLSLQGNMGWKRRKFVRIFQSTLGPLRVKDNYDLIIMECNVRQRLLESTLINISNSEMTISNSMFYQLQFQSGQMLLNASTSRIKFKDVEVRETVTSEGLIKVSNDSNLELDSSQFVDNQVLTDDEYSSLVSITIRSSVLVLNSTFISNKGGFLYSYAQSKISAYNSTFYNNTGFESGVISSKGKNTHINLHGNDFVANISPHGGADIHVEDTTVDIYNCSFSVSNGGPGAVLGVGSHFFASDCVFKSLMPTPMYQWETPDIKDMFYMQGESG